MGLCQLKFSAYEALINRITNKFNHTNALIYRKKFLKIIHFNKVVVITLISTNLLVKLHYSSTSKNKSTA